MENLTLIYQLQWLDYDGEQLNGISLYVYIYISYIYNMSLGMLIQLIYVISVTPKQNLFEAGT